ncbi:MAG: glycosyltransferase 87 family protein [Chloroflexota bacterium]
MPNKTFSLVVIGVLSCAMYATATLYGAFRPDRIQAFLGLFGVAFALYAAACWLVVCHPPNSQRSLITIFGFAVAFNTLLFPMLPSLSDDMYRYVWDGRVQANGINPYRYPSNANETAYLRDDQIWARMNRPAAVTVYPPGAQIAFAAIWRVFPDSIAGFKLVFIACVIAAGGLLVPLLKQWGVDPSRVLIFLWNPLIIFEIAHSAHVDALYLPLIVGALLLRLTAPTHRVSLKHEAGIGVLIGLATLIKLYPVLLIPALWSVQGRRFRGRLLLPITALITIAAGYALYIAPGVDTLGFLPSYTREYYNIAPLPMALANWAQGENLAYYQPTMVLLPLVIVLISLYFVMVPARDAKTAMRRCLWPIGASLLITINLFSWYALWTLPFVALDLTFSPFRAAFGWWLFTGLIVLSYHVYITGYAQAWVTWLEFAPLYGILALAAIAVGRDYFRKGQTV